MSQTKEGEDSAGGKTLVEDKENSPTTESQSWRGIQTEFQTKERGLPKNHKGSSG